MGRNLNLNPFNKKSDASPPEAGTSPSADVLPNVPQARPRAPRPPKRSRNTGWMTAGAALIVIAGIAAASIASSLSQSVDVLVASRPIAEGAVISAQDYRTVAIAADTGAIEAISPDDADRLIGQLASGPIGSGSILHPDQFTSRADQDVEGTVVIGADLTPNDLPLLDLLPGDRVRLFETFDQGSVSIGAFGDDEDQLASVAREVTDAEVVLATPLTGEDLHVALRINESNANIVANLVEQSRLIIVLVDSLPSTSAVAPTVPGEPLSPGEPGDTE